MRHKRDQQLAVPLTAREKKAVEKAAEKAGDSMAAWARKLIMKEIAR